MKILVMGAGVIGVTSAYYLARDGHEVHVLDRHEAPASETSFANAGLIAPGHAYTWNSPRAPLILLKSLVSRDQAFRLKLSADPRMWQWCFRFLANCTAEKARLYTVRKLKLCVYSQQELHGVVAETGIAYDSHRAGLLYLYHDEASLALGAAKMEILRANGMELRRLDRAQTVQIEPALVPERIAGAIYAPGDESGDANLFTRRLAEICAKRGVSFSFKTKIEGIESDGDRVAAVRTDKGRFVADAFVMALGCDSATMARPLGVRLPVYPVKGYSLTFPIGARHRAPSIGGVDENRLVAFARLGDRLRLTATAEFSGYDTTHAPADFRSMLITARALFPNGADYDQPKYWACLRPMTPGGTPIIGPTRYANLFLNTGHGHMGWTMACGSAHLLADAIARRKPEIDVAPFLPAA